MDTRGRDERIRIVRFVLREKVVSWSPWVSIYRLAKNAIITIEVEEERRH